MASQEASAHPNSTLSREGPSWERSNPWDSAASWETSASPNNSTLSREGTSQEGSNPQSGNSLVSSQAGNNLVSNLAIRCSARPRAAQDSQVDSDIPQWNSEVSWGSQVVRCLLRHRAPSLPRPPRRMALLPRQVEQVLREVTLLLPLTVGLIKIPRVPLWRNPTLSGSLTCPANLWPQHKGLF